MAVVLASAALAVAWQVVPASAVTAQITQISSDPLTQATCAASAATNHATEVEPDTFGYGSTVVAAFQVGRVYDGGACAIGFATSTNNGASWTSGLLPGLTKYAGGGTYDRATDASVAYDARHNSWLVSSLVLTESGGVAGAAVLTSASTDGGLTWAAPTVTAASGDMDKNWIVCDNGASSPYYGHCYTQWDDHGAGNLLHMAVSADGGSTWTTAATGSYGVIGGQPVVAPNGTVVVPIDNANETAVGAFTSTNGGTTWSAITTITTISHHRVAGRLREGPLPSAEIDGAGTVYVAWSDCRFRRGCKTNDIVVTHSTSSTYTSWSSVSRVPIDATNSSVDHFLPGLAVNRATSGNGAQLGVTYYFYPARSTQLSVGFLSTTDAGGTWGAPQTVASGMPTSWLASTSQGRMVGDYISTSYGSDNLAHGVFATSSAPLTGASTSCTTTALDNCVEPTSTFTAGLAAGTASSANDPVLYGSSSGSSAASLWHVVDNNGVRHR